MSGRKFFFSESPSINSLGDASKLVGGFPAERQSLLHHLHEFAFRNARIALGRIQVTANVNEALARLFPLSRNDLHIAVDVSQWTYFGPADTFVTTLGFVQT